MMKEKMIRLCDYNKEVEEPIRYHKIPSLWKRDENGEFTEKYTSQLVRTVFKSDIIMVVLEKIDGTNVRVYWDGYDFSFWGRKGKSEMPESLIKKLESIFDNETMEALFEQIFGKNEVIIFGEGIGKKISGGRYYNGDYDLIVFDVMVNGRYVNYLAFVDIVATIGLKDAPILETIDDVDSLIKLIKDYDGEIPSKLNENYPAEGYVVKPLNLNLYDNRGERCIVKIKQKDYRQEGGID